MPSKSKTAALKAAFPHTVPIMAGFLFLGITYGVYMHASGFSAWYPFLMSVTIFGGSLEFVAVSMLMSSFAPLQTLLVAFVLQARHLFYGIAMLEKYRGTGRKKWYLIFGMCDESFSINYAVTPPPEVDRGWFMFFVTLLNHAYWVTGATLGGLLGALISFDMAGIEFVMTALFVVIFLEQWRKEKRHISSVIGVLSAAGCLAVFGKESFMIPTLLCMFVLIWCCRRPIEKAGDE